MLCMARTQDQHVVVNPQLSDPDASWRRLHTAQAFRSDRKARPTNGLHAVNYTACAAPQYAVALLQSGTDGTVIQGYLVHASVATTGKYITTNLQMRHHALQAFWKQPEIEPRAKPWSFKPDLLAFLQALRATFFIQSPSSNYTRFRSASDPWLTA